MVLAIVCPKCQQTGEHSEVYRGCMRPCPHCGELVSLATPEDAPVRKLPTEECWCGHPCDERGMYFELGYRQHIKPSFLARHFPMVRLFTGEERERIEVIFVDGWACEKCCGRILRLRRWFIAPYVITLVLWLACMFIIALATNIKTTAQLSSLLLTWGLISLVIILPVVFFVCRVVTGIISYPLKKRFGRGNIVKVKILN